MRIKLDENVPFGLVEALAALGHNVDTVQGEGLQGRSDPDVWSAAQSEGRFLITQDLDFSDIRRFRPGTHAGVLLVRLHNPGRESLARRVQELFATEDTARWVGCFVVTTEAKLRVRRAERQGP